MSEALDISTFIVVHTLDNGDCIAHPAAEPKFVSYGADADCLLEQRLFLSEYLTTVEAEAMARYSMPANSRLEDVQVELTRHDGPRDRPFSFETLMPCVCIPDKDATWVVVLALGLTVYVAPDEELHEVVGDEIERLIGAMEPPPQEFLDLLPAARRRLEPMTITVNKAHGSQSAVVAVSGLRAKRKKLETEQKQKTAVAILDSVARPLHDDKALRHGPPVLERDTELTTLGALLDGDARQSVLLVGDEIVGKTALLHAWMRRRAEAGRPAKVWATSGARLMAGMSGLGQWQARVRRVMEAVEVLDAYLYFDDLTDLFGDQMKTTADIPSAMRPFLDRSKTRVIGEITPAALDRVFVRAVGFLSAFHQVRVEPQSVEVARKVLTGRAEFIHEKAGRAFDTTALSTIVDLCDRYLPYRPFPGKAVRLFEEVHAAANQSGPDEGPIGSADVFDAFSVRTGIPAFLLREDRPLRAEEVRRNSFSGLIGQTDAVRRVVDTICVVKAGLQSAGKPLATFLFVGPTGVGKTELARILAKFLFGGSDRLVRFDMSEFMDPNAAQRLIRGTDSEEGLLTSKVRQQPFCVVLLDEIEKADSAVFDLLLQVCGEGRLTDAKGRTTFFENAIIIMTSNLGASHKSSKIGIGASKTDGAERYLDVVSKSFRPEFVNRLDRIIPFSALEPAEVEQVAVLVIDKVRSRRGFLDMGVTLEVTDAALGEIARGGYSAEYGARALRRYVEDALVAPTARLLSALAERATNAKVVLRAVEEKSPTGGRIARETGDRLIVDVFAGLRNERQGGHRSLLEIVNFRRQMARAMRYETVERVKEHIEFLLTQLNYGTGVRPGAQRTSQDLSEHARLSKLYNAAKETLARVEAIEELALETYATAEDLDELRIEAEDLQIAFDKNLVPLLLCMENRAHEATVLLKEHNGRPLDRWLLPLIDSFAARGWQASFHFAHEPPKADEQWYPNCPWGPPRPAEDAVRRIELVARSATQLIMCIRGPYAGVFMHLESGLHRHRGFESDPEHFNVSVLATRAQLNEKQWRHESIQPSGPESQSALLPVRALVELSPKGFKLWFEQKENEMDPADYWKDFEVRAAKQLVMHETRENLDMFEIGGGFLDALEGGS